MAISLGAGRNRSGAAADGRIAAGPSCDAAPRLDGGGVSHDRSPSWVFMASTNGREAV